MNYEKLYFAFIEKFKTQDIESGVYTEVHHIIPRYAGGGDESSNLVKLTYRQHVFVHLLWYKYTGHPKAKLAYTLMSGIEPHVRKARARCGGEMNVLSGHLDRIRPLSNTPERRAKLELLNARKREDPIFAKKIGESISKANKGKPPSEEARASLSASAKARSSRPEEHERNMEALRKAKLAQIEKSRKRSEDIIKNAERNDEYLHMTSSRSKNKFVSPEGLIFDSPIFAAKYYGGQAYSTLIEKWCKTNLNGWYTIPKTEQV